jgi:hypothetical protein
MRDTVLHGKRVRRRGSHLLLLVLILVAGSARAVGAGEEEHAPTAEERLRRERVEKLVAYFAEMYGRYLESRDWIARSMATLGLARIDDPAISRQLVEVMTGDREPAVRVYAWAALHARLDSLSDAQRRAWADAGSDLARGGELRGDLRVGLVRWMGYEGPTADNAGLYRHLFEHTNATDPADMRTLAAMRDVLAAWRHEPTIRTLVDALSDLDDAYRAEYLLAGLELDVPRPERFERLGIMQAWRRVRIAWRRKVRELRERPLKARDFLPYAGEDAILPAPQPIEDPADPTWRRDLELPRFKLDHLDVSFALDTTGSMMPVIEWMKRDVDKMLRAFHLLSYEPRIGVTLYRDRGDAYVVRSSPLTDQLEKLRDALADARARGGGDRPEAVYEALQHILDGQKWSSGHYARRAIVLVGDAPPHPDTRAAVRDLVTASAGEGFRFYTVKCGRGAASLTEFDEIAQWGRGKSLEAEFASRGGAGGLRRVPYRDPRTRRDLWILHGLADPAGAEGPSRQVVREIARLAMPEAYRDRAGPFLDVFLEYAEGSEPERRLLPRTVPAWL